jgi:hypothetical protein
LLPEAILRQRLLSFAEIRQRTADKRAPGRRLRTPERRNRFAKLVTAVVTALDNRPHTSYDERASRRPTTRSLGVQKLLPITEPTVRTPRQERDIQRMRRAARAAEGGKGSPALAGALAQIGAAFDEAAMVNGFKMRVERLIHLGPHHPAVRARFGARAAMLCGRDLAASIVVVERWWNDERKAFQIASALGCASRLSLEVLCELRLILRLMRFRKMEAEYASILTALHNVPIAAAAE